jgi:carboxylesterase
VSAPVIAGAEPYSATGDGRGALVLHGFTGNPQSMRGLALALADAGFTVEMPLLPGHGTQIEDMLDTTWADWSAAAEDAYTELAARSDGVVVVGLSMGGMLSVWLAEHHPEIAAIAVVNPLLVPPDADTLGFIQAMIDGGDEIAPGIGSDIAMEGAVEAAYPGSPLRAALSLFAGAA